MKEKVGNKEERLLKELPSLSLGPEALRKVVEREKEKLSDKIIDDGSWEEKRRIKKLEEDRRN